MSKPYNENGIISATLNEAETELTISGKVKAKGPVQITQVGSSLTFDLTLQDPNPSGSYSPQPIAITVAATHAHVGDTVVFIIDNTDYIIFKNEPEPSSDTDDDFVEVVGARGTTIIMR